MVATKSILLGACLLALACPACNNGPRPGPAVADASARPAPPSETEIAARITGSILIHGRSMSYLQELTEIGARPTGSAAFERATEWGVKSLKDAGIAHPQLERFPITNRWERGEAKGRIVAPIEKPIRISSVGWAPPTPTGGLRAEVVALADISPENVAAEAAKIKDRIVLIEPATVFKGGFQKGIARLSAAYVPLRDAGVRGLLWPSRLPNNGFKAHLHFWEGGIIGPLPGADIAADDVKELRDLMAKGPVVVEIDCPNKVLGPAEVANVIAEIRGREKPEEWILVGAHLDSWDVGPGAQDNASGVAMVLDAARAISALGVAPRRSIRFALWAAEEQGILGSDAYAAAHASELDACAGVLNTDDGAAEPRGWQVQGRDDVASAMKPVAELLAGLGGGGLSPEVSGNSDHSPFSRRGVPTMNLWVDTEHYMEIHHQKSDTIEKVKPHPLASGAAIVAVTAWTLAERSDRIAPRLGKSELEAWLKKVDLYEPVKGTGK